VTRKFTKLAQQVTSWKSVGRRDVLNMVPKQGKQKQHEHSDIAEILQRVDF